jgi:hypothetical protein
MKFLICFALVFSLGCASTRIESNGEPTLNSQTKRNWYLLFGFVPLTHMHATDYVCTDGNPTGKWAATTFESTFLDIAITTLTAGLIIPETMRTECR